MEVEAMEVAPGVMEVVEGAAPEVEVEVVALGVEGEVAVEAMEVVVAAVEEEVTVAARASFTYR